MMKEVKKRLQDEIVNGLDDTFEEVFSIISPNSEVYRDLLLMKSRYKKAAKDYRLNLISYNDYSVIDSKISNSVLALIDDLEEADFTEDFLAQYKRDEILKSTVKTNEDLNKYRRPSKIANEILSLSNEQRLIVGDVIELDTHPNLKTQKRLDQYGWNPLNKDEIEVDFRRRRFDIGKLTNEFALDKTLNPPNGRKFCLSKVTGALIDEPPIKLELEYSDYFTIKSLLNKHHSVLPVKLIERFGSISPDENQIPHSLCLHNFILLDDGNILCQLRSRRLGYHKGKLSISQEEQFSIEDLDQQVPELAHLMMRGLCEEIFPLSGGNHDIVLNFNKYLEPLVDCMNIWSVFLESSIFNFTLMGFTKLNIDVKEYVNFYKNLMNKGNVDKEGKLYFMSLEQLEELFKTGSSGISGVFSNKEQKFDLVNLHPSSLYRAYRFLVQSKMI